MEELDSDVKDFWVNGSLPVLDNPSQQEFNDMARSWHPTIIHGIADRWQAHQKWSLDYLSHKLGSQKLACQATPNGRADSIQEGFFCFPAEVKMSMSELVESLRDQTTESAVVYLSTQNDNLRAETPQLLSEIEHIPYAEQIWGKPEAVNLWAGNQRSLSALHKDYYENIYAVVSGTKEFLLYPPSDAIKLQERTFPSRKYCLKGNSRRSSLKGLKKDDFVLTECQPSEVSWIPFDSDSMDQPSHSADHLHPIRITVKAGECLYLPALWFHQVSQQEETVSVNYWYPFQFDHRYVFFNAMSRLNQDSLKNES